jgi:signal transduction histidine kinase
VELPEAGRVVIGRVRLNDVVLPHPLVSKRHAEIEAGPNGITVRDLGSKNGTWVNWKRITEPQSLGPNDSLVIGRYGLRIVAVPSGGGTSVVLTEDVALAQRICAAIDSGTAGSADEYRHLALQKAMGEVLLTSRDEVKLCDGVLALIFRVFPAERAAVVLRNPDGSVDVPNARARTRDGAELDLSRTILLKSVEEGISVLTADAGTDRRFSSGDSVILQGIRSAMCAPLRGREEVFGAVYADTQTASGAFKKGDLEILTALGIQGGVALESLRLTARSMEQERLAAVGGVVAGLSHDIANILASLKMGIEVVDRAVGKVEEKNLREAWSIVRQGSDTITSLVRDMVSLSKDRKLAKEPADLNALVLKISGRFTGLPDVELRTEMGPGVDQVPVDETAVERILTNLLANARDALGEEGGTIVLRTFADAEAGVAVLSVIDDGPGIPLEDLDRIFDVLFSTKGSKGTGFGLAVCRKLAEEHGGSIRAESAPGEGAAFHVTLPLVDDSSEG